MAAECARETRVVPVHAEDRQGWLAWQLGTAQRQQAHEAKLHRHADQPKNRQASHQHRKGDEDLDLVWELFEIIWCLGHPVYKTHTSRDLDILCEHITKRKDSFARKRRVERVDELLWIGQLMATSSRFVGVYGAFRDVWMDSILPLVMQCEGHCV